MEMLRKLAQNNAISHNSNHLPYRKELSSYLIDNYHIFDTFIKNLHI